MRKSSQKMKLQVISQLLFMHLLSDLSVIVSVHSGLVEDQTENETKLAFVQDKTKESKAFDMPVPTPRTTQPASVTSDQELQQPLNSDSLVSSELEDVIPEDWKHDDGLSLDQIQRQNNTGKVLTKIEEAVKPWTQPIL